MPDKPVIRASEIGAYVFCHRAWWLRRVKGLESANRAQMEAGISKHIQHGHAVQRADTMRRIAIVLFVLAFFFALLFCLAIIFPAL
jgi:CRISPR/Cas system-associated exonuclease Cas4 (RecB family)